MYRLSSYVESILEFIAETRNKNEAKFKFQGQFARSQRWFDLDFDLIEVNLAHGSLIYINFFGDTTIHNIQIHLKYFKLQ